MAVISLPTHAMGPFGMPMTPGDGSSGGEGGGTTFGGKAISQSGSTWVYDGPDANSAVDSFTGITWVNSGNSFVASVQTAGTNNQYGIYQFDTTTAYSTQPSDISFNASFLTYNEIADADFSPKSIIFNSDGSKGFFIEDNELFGFDMSTNYDISTATGTGHTKTSLPNLYGPNDVRFNNNGTKMFVSDVTFGTPIVIEYSLNPAYDVTTRSQTASFDPSQAANGGTNIFGIQFNIDGTKMYALGNGGAGGQRYLYEYDLSTAFDLTTISYNNERLDLQTFAGIDLAESFTFNDDFSKLYIADGNDGVLQFDWGTPPGGGRGSGTPDTIDKATGSLGLTTNGATDSQWFEFNGDGTSLFVHNTGSGGLAPAGYLLNQFNLTTPYDLTTASYSNNVYYGSGNDFEGKFAGDGSKFYYDSGTLWQHNLSSAFVPGTDIRASGQADGQGPSGESFCFKNDGTKLYTLAKSNTPNGVIEWDLSTAWDITTNSLQGGAIAGNNLDYSNEMTGASNIEMNSTGTKVYIYTRNSTISGASIAIVEYDMTTPWDINTGTYNGKYLNVGSAGFTSAERISFRLENDNKIFIKGPNSNHSGNDVIYQYTIPNASSGGGSNALTDGWTVKSTFSGMSNERFYSIGDDSNNNFYAAGYDAVDDTILVASYDKDGTYRWSYNAGGTSDRLYDTAVDTNGNMVAVGYSMSTTGGSTPFPALIVKYTSAGSLVWSRALNDSSSENWLALAVTTDSSDNIYIAGRTQAQSNGNNDLPFVAKLNNAGAVQWVKKYDHGGQQSQPEGIALDSNGDIIVSGRIHEQITGGGYSAGMVFKASGTDGSIIWNKFFDDGEPVNGYHNDQFQNVAITPEDDILTCGWTNKDYAGTYYGIVLKLSGTDGSIVWQRHTNEEDGTKKIAVDSAGKIYTFTDSEVLFVYASDGTLEQEWKITASGSGADAYYIEDVYIDKNDNAVLCGFFYTGGGDPAFPFITKLPATIQAGTTGDFVITAQSKGDSAGGLNPTTFTSYTANTMSGVITNGTSGLTPNSVSATNTGPTTVTGASGGGGGQSQPQGWIATISDEISGYGYPDARFSSLDVDSNDNIYIGGDAGTNNQIVVKMASDGTVTSAASFGGSGATNNHRAIAVASDESVYSAGEAKDIWNRLDGHVFRFTSSLTKSYDNFFGEGSNDEHYDITADDSGNVFAVGEAQSYSAAFAQDPKGYIVKYDSTGGVAKTQISTSFQRSYPQGISSDGTDVYVIAKDQNHMFVAKVNSALNSVTWSKQWGGASAEPRIMDIDTNSSGESAALMYESNKWRLAKIDSSGNATWRITWEKASTDHGDAYPGYDFSAGYAVKLLANGSIAVLSGHMPWTTQANKKSLYIIVFDSTGTPTFEKEFRLTQSSHYLKQVSKSLGELSDGKIVFAASYYKGSNSAGSGYASSVFKFDPTDTSTAINGVHGDWEISTITDSTVGTDSTTYTGATTSIFSTNMSMYGKNGYQGATSGFGSGLAAMTSETKTTLNYVSGSATPSGVLFNTTGTHQWTVPAGVSTISVVAVGGGGGGYGYWNVDATQLRIGTGGSGGHLTYSNNIYVTPGETLDVTVGAGGAKGNQFGGAYGSVTYSAQPGVSSNVSRSGTILVQAKGGDAIGNSSPDSNVGLASYSGGSGGGHGSTVTGGGGGGGAGGYSGTGGSGGSDQFNPWSPTAPGGSGSGGGGSGGRGAGGQTSTGQGGGGVGVYGEGSSGTGGNGAGGSGGTNGSSSAGGVYGGGGGAGYTSVVGAQGGVRIIWGDANTSRTFPSTNVDQASSTDAETTV